MGKIFSRPVERNIATPQSYAIDSGASHPSQIPTPFKKTCSDYFSHIFDLIPQVTAQEKKAHIESVLIQIYRENDTSTLTSFSVSQFKTAVNLSLAILSASGEIGRKTAEDVQYIVLGYEMDPATNTSVYSRADPLYEHAAIILKFGDTILPPWLFSKQLTENIKATFGDSCIHYKIHESTPPRKEAAELTGRTRVKEKITVYENLGDYVNPIQLPTKNPTAADNFCQPTDVSAVSQLSKTACSDYYAKRIANTPFPPQDKDYVKQSIEDDIERLRWLIIDIISMDNAKNYTEAQEMLNEIEFRLESESTNHLLLKKNVEMIKDRLFTHQFQQLVYLSQALSNAQEKSE